MERLRSRREVLQIATKGAIATAVVSGLPLTAVQSGQASSSGKLWPGYPRQDQKLVAEVVGAAHFNEQRVKELVATYPELVNAWWDWGFGDWESALGAASHVGERGIAEFLLSKGARMDIFAAAMLGHTAVVKALVAATPGIERTLGPHNISLLAHAEAGGDQAKDTVDFLKTLDGSGSGIETQELTVERKPLYLGEYSSDSDDLKMTCRLNRTEMLVADFQTSSNQSTGRLLRFIGSDTFFPAGVPSVKIRFSVVDGQAVSAIVSGSVPTVSLSRV